MADKRISELPVADTLADDALIPMYQNGKTQTVRGNLIAKGNYDANAAGLPLVVSGDGTAKPVKLAAKGISGAELVSGSESGGDSGSNDVDLTAERRDGYYVNATTGGDSPFNGLSIGRALIDSGKTYYVTLWVDESVGIDAVGFYTSGVSDGNGGYLGKDFTKTVTFTLVDADNCVYSFVAPDGAIRINYTYWTDKGGFIKESYSGGDNGGGSDTPSEDLTYYVFDDYYFYGDNGALVSNTTLKLSVGQADVVAGKQYFVTLWDKPSSTQKNVLGFFSMKLENATTHNGGYLGLSVTQGIEFTLVDETRSVYSFVAPEGAVCVRYTYRQATGGFIKEATSGVSVTAVEVSESEPAAYKLPWLRIYEENLSDEVKGIIASAVAAKKTYGHSLSKPFEFSGKKMTAFGDSITFGISSPNLVYTYSPYIKTFADKCGMTLTNKAVSGTCITDSDDNQNSIYKKLTTFTDAADVILVAGGTNDYGTGKPLGEYASTDVTTFYGAMRGICEALKTNHADATVIFVTPIERTDKATAAVESLNAYRNAIFEIASEYRFNVVDGSMLGFPDKTGGFNDFMLADGCHPTQAGHDFYARNLYTVLT